MKPERLWLVALVASLPLQVADAASSADEELLQAGIHFVPPEGWTRSVATGASPGFVFTSHDRRASITIPQPRRVMPLSLWLAWSMLRTTKKPEQERETKLASMTCRVFEFQERYAGGGFAKVQEYHCPRGGLLYTINYVAKTQDFDRYLPDFEESLGSFSLSQ